MVQGHCSNQYCRDNQQNPEHIPMDSFSGNVLDTLTVLENYTFRDLSVNTLRPRQNGRHFTDDIFKRIFLNENILIPIKISLKFVPKGSINIIPALVQIMAWRHPGAEPLSEPVMVNLPTHICVTRPQCVKSPSSMLLLLFQWEVKPPMPSSCMRNICKQMCKLHEAMVDLLPPDQVLVSTTRLIHHLFA